MANATSPGGGYRKGDGAQEENIFRRSDYYQSLDGELADTDRSERIFCTSKCELKPFAGYGGLYPIPEFGAIYTSGITVFRQTETNGYAYMKNPLYNVCAIAIPAYRDPELTRNNMLENKFAVKTHKKIENIFTIAHHHKHDCLVLSAFGCGAFRNPPEHIAALFKSVIYQYAGYFETIYFAIVDDHNTGNAINPLGNFLPFQQILDGLVVRPPTTLRVNGANGPYRILDKSNNQLTLSDVCILYLPPCQHGTKCQEIKDAAHNITGAASGIGRVTALELAKQQARVIVGIRGQERAEHVAQQLSKESHGNVIGYHLDLSDLASVKVFAEKIDKVDILINNAGVNKKHKELTNDGLESTFGTNHIGHFYLTQLLLPLLIQSNGRIVNVSSIMHILANENIDFSKTNAYNTMLVYAESKLANILHIVELQRRYGGRGIKTYSLHPGFIRSTELTRERTLLQAILMILFAISSKTIAQGAITTLYCALSDEAQPGKYHSNCRVTQPSLTAYNSKKAQELWELTSHSKQSFDEVIKFRCYFDIKEENIDNKGNFTLTFVRRCLDLLLVQESNVRASDTQLLDLKI
ncbi:unnamed protein product [Rotaria sordida]|uniref:Microbial-type PARG catalytic domain-containing protein n=1 Tax=Rotaria sordida TaxID=392033 RepID=A0A814TVF2_9BILA|nr:unnamed protein product [Rotaria sordida]